MVGWICRVACGDLLAGLIDLAGGAAGPDLGHARLIALHVALAALSGHANADTIAERMRGF
jgi:hypothetical protein